MVRDRHPRQDALSFTCPSGSAFDGGAGQTSARDWATWMLTSHHGSCISRGIEGLSKLAGAVFLLGALGVGTGTTIGQVTSTQWRTPLISGAWTTPARWTGGTVPNNGIPPGTLYDTLLPAGAYNVTLGVPIEVNSLTLAGIAIPPSGAALTITPGGELRSLLPIRVQTSAQIVVAGGSLSDTTINLDPGSALSISGTTPVLRGMTINGTATAGGTISIRDGLTLNGLLTISTQSDIVPLTPLMLSGVGHLRGTQNQVIVRPPGPMVMTVGPQFRLDASIYGSGSTLLNNGTMSPVTNSTFILTRLENNGVITLNGLFTLDVAGYFGSGVIRGAAGSSVQFASNFPELDAKFDFTQADVIFRNTVNTRIRADRRALTWIFDTCVINSPTVETADNRRLNFRNGVTFNGSIISGEMNAANEVIFNGGSTRGRIFRVGNQTIVRFNGRWTNEAEIELGNPDFLVMSGSGVNAAPVTINGGSFLIEQQAINSALVTVTAGGAEFRNALTTDEFSLFALPGTRVGLLGTIDNTGRTLSLGANAASWTLGCRIRGGTLGPVDHENILASNELGATFEGVEINRTLDLSGPRGVRLEGVTSGTGAVTATEITLANNALLAIRAMATQRVFLEGAVEIAPGGALTLSSSRIASLDPNNLGSLNNRGTLAIVPQSGQNITLSEFRSPGTLMTVAGAFPPTGQLVIENVKGTMGPIRFDYGDVLFRGPLAVADTVIFTDTTIKSVSVTGRWRNPGLLHLLPGGVLSGRNQAIPGSVQNGRLVEGTWVLNGEMNIADFTENAASIEVRPGGAIFTIGPGIRTNTGTFAVTEGGGFSFRSGLTNSGRLRVRGLGSQTSVTGTLACLPNSTIELELAAAESAVPITASVRATLAGTLAIASAPGLEGPGIRFVTLLTAPVVSGKFDTVVLPASLVASVRRYPTRVVLTTCPADFDLDGVAGPDDLADFISAYFTVPAPNSVDMDDDGVVTPDDLANFVTMYFDGCG